MTSPVVVSRIQNRRGTQDQFNGYVYNPAGPNSVYPAGYSGVGGYGSFPTFNALNYPNVLLPGELALCTDSRRIFMGNLNGEYVEIEIVLGDGLFLKPAEWILDPSPTFEPVAQIPHPLIKLEYNVTPFFTILYDVTNSTNPDWNTTGQSFSKNGELKITAINNGTPVPLPILPHPPFPVQTQVNLTDTSTEVNFLIPSDIHFKAQYNLIGDKIEILYRHDFPTPLRFYTSTISWVPFIPII